MKFNILSVIVIAVLVLCKPSHAAQSSYESSAELCHAQDGCRISDIATDAYHEHKYKSAYKLFKESCSSGDARGCFGVGLMLDEGKGIDEDPKFARSYFSMSCENGYYTGCFYLGASLRNGRGGKKDLDASHLNFLKACEDNQARACFNVALNYYDGLGVVKNRQKALYYLSLIHI